MSFTRGTQSPLSLQKYNDMTSTMDIEVPSVQVLHFMWWGVEGGIGQGSNGMIGPWPHHHILHRGGVGWGGGVG